MSAWFPRPRRIEDVIEVAGSGVLGAGELFERLRDPSAEEWRDKVGVGGSREGSAKPSARLLAVEGWVFKTEESRCSQERSEVVLRLQSDAARASRLRLWHPSKLWFGLDTSSGIYPVTACRQLRVVRTLDEKGAVRIWARVLAMSWRASVAHGVGLDIHPSNFGLDRDALYYLDDELYPPLRPFELGEAVAGRIPEGTDHTPPWRTVGREVARELVPLGLTSAQWRDLEDGLMAYPMVAQREDARLEVRAGLRDVYAPRRPKRSVPRRVCVFADVHANLPAFEAVLAMSERLGASEYLFLGDAVGYGPHPRECVERLRTLEPLTAICGNHDYGASQSRTDELGMNRDAREALRWTIAQLTNEDRAWLASLPRETGGEDWLAVHGAPRDPERFYAYVYELTFRENLSLLAESQWRVCFYGHTHVQFVHRKVADGDAEKLGPVEVTLSDAGSHYLINPGSVGQPRDGDTRAAFAIWDRTEARVTFHRVAYPVETTIQDLLRAGLAEDLGNRLEVGR